MFEGTTICVIFKSCDYLEFFKLTILMGERGMVDTSSSTTSLTGLLATSKVKFSLPATSKVKVSLTGVFSTSTVRLPGLVVPLLGLRQAIGAASCSLLWKEFSMNFHLSNMKRYYRATDSTASPPPPPASRLLFEKKNNFAPKHPWFGLKISYRIGGNLPTSSFAKENLTVSLILLIHTFLPVVFDCLPYTCQTCFPTCFLKGWVFPKDRGPLDHHLLQPVSAQFKKILSSIVEGKSFVTSTWGTRPVSTTQARISSKLWGEKFIVRISEEFAHTLSLSWKISS